MVKIVRPDGQGVEARWSTLTSTQLGAELLAQAQRRGRSSVDWAEYFRNAYISS